jgi:DNA-binding response OmpR family regulator
LVRGLVSRLRVKVETDPRQPEYIQTVPGVGYTFKGNDE